MKKIARAITIGCLFTIPSASVFANDLPARGPIPFASYDTDKDGFISPEEFYATQAERMGTRTQAGMPMRGLAGAPSFEDFDTDHDGRLTESELRLGQTQRMQQRPGAGGQGMGPGMGPGRGPGRGPGQGPGAAGRNLPSFADYDVDADGRITRQEFDNARSARIQERARQGGMMRNLPNAPAFDDIDTDRDGTITEQEFAAHQMQRRGSRGRP